jgi:Xaa-Pro aminopeptidase
VNAPPPELLAARRQRVARLLSTLNLDALIVSHLPNVRYLTDFESSAATALLTPASLELVTDTRYETVARSMHDVDVRIVGPGSPADDALAAALAEGEWRRIGFEAARMSVARHGRVARALAAAEARTPRELLATEGVVEACRAVKDPYEIEVLREAARRLSAVAIGVLADIGPNARESEVAGRVEAGLRRAGFSGPAFDTIVASGSRSALPHARSTDRVIAAGDLVVLDFGGIYGGYCVDLTRTICLGRASDETRRVYDAVLAAQQAAIRAVAPGRPVVDVDRAARESLTTSGLGDAFVHGTGHGLGLEVHEAPRVTKASGRLVSYAPGTAVVADPDMLEAGMVFTIEPGAYLPGWGGVRIEDDVLVTADGCEVLTSVPRHLEVG